MASRTLFTLFLLPISIFPAEAAFDINLNTYFSPNASFSWTNNNDSLRPLQVGENSIARLILLDQADDLRSISYVFGFYCRRAWRDLCQLVILLVEDPFTSTLYGMKPQVVWSANRHHLVGENATLEISYGDLVLEDNNGMKIWSTNTSSLRFAGITIGPGPNLILFDSGNQILWQSFDHPTDTLLTGQQLRLGQRLTSGPPLPGSTVDLFSLSMEDNVLTGSIHTDTSVPYLTVKAGSNASMPAGSLRYVSFEKGNVTFGSDVGHADLIRPTSNTTIRSLPPFQFLKLDPDGDLRIYSWQRMEGWKVVHDFMEGRDPCHIPLRCGYYGVCRHGQCSCPTAVDGVQYFSPNDQYLEMGCSEVATLAAEDKYEMVDFGSMGFLYTQPRVAAYGIQKLDDCKQACLRNASCKAVFFTHEKNSSDGLCYLPSYVLTIQGEDVTERASVSSTYLKVRALKAAPPPALSPSSSLSPPRRAKYHKLLMGFVIFISVSISVFAIFLAIALWKRLAYFNEDPIQWVQGMPVRFSYKDLCAATGEFSEKIGQGGFGAVFRGVLRDGTPVAVKRLDGDEQGMDEFVAEVKTIGSIHHINLVQLIGFCAEKSHRVLVYEYMSNGSLDRWIFGSKKEGLDWKTKLKIITDIAKGLAYLHEECRQSIAHLDMKPHNVLLDDEFNAKISDFGLARVMDRNRSQNTTTLRGTLGYLAPEWQVSGHITVKVDVYSFGIVLLEILCGRKNLDYEQHDSHIRLLSLLLRNTNDHKLIGIIPNPVAEMQCQEQEDESLRLIRIGLWCLNDDYKKRPSMSTVVKALEGAIDLDSQISFRVSHTMIPSPNTGVMVSSPDI